MTRILFLIFFSFLTNLFAIQVHAEEICTKTKSTCLDNGCKKQDGSWFCFDNSPNKPAGHFVVDGECWNLKEEYECEETNAADTCSSANINGCALATSDCSLFKSSIGVCQQTSRQYVCTHDVTTTYDPHPPHQNCRKSSWSNCNKHIGSYCVDEDSRWTCIHATPEDCITDPECTLVSEDCMHQESGLCAMVEQSYDCNYSESKCNSWKMTNSCTNIMTDIPDIITNQGGNFEKAAAAAALVNMLKEGLDGTDPLRIFPGKEQRCKETVGCSLTGACCCGKDAEKNPNFLGVWKCNDSDAELYARKKKELVVHLKSGCVDGLKNPLGSGCAFCTAKAEWYCTFENKLAKEVQVQGRKQLAALATLGFSDAQKKSISFNFYGESNRWVDLGLVNNNRLWYYQYHDKCNQIELSNSDPECPGMLSAYFAVCDGDGCSAPTYQPPQKQNDDRVNVISVNPFYEDMYTLSRNVVLSGSCDTDANCNYSAYAWKGGSYKTPLNFFFKEFQGTGNWSEYVQVKNIKIRAYTYGSNESATQVKLEVTSGEGTNNYNVSDYLIPREISIEQNYKIPTTDIRVYGKCDQHNQCAFNLVAPLGSVAKPFLISSGKSGCKTSVTADCSGYTIEEFSLLDFDKMDLAFLARDLQPKTPDLAVLENNAREQVEEAHLNTVSDRTVAWINKGYCETSCNVKLEVVEQWLPSTTRVSRVNINWGDGSSNTNTSNTYIFNHTFNKIGTHTIKINFTLEDGNEHYAELRVQVVDPYDPSGSNMGATKPNREASALW